MANNTTDKTGFTIDHSKTNFAGVQFFGPDGKPTTFAKNHLNEMSNKPSTEIRVDLLLEFLAQHYFPTRNKTEMIASWEAFKASHSSVGEGRDWEIFELKDGTEFSALVDGDYWLKKQAVKITAKGISDAGMIKSVRRLSDGEVFSVGELIGVSQMTLVRFEIIKGGLYAYCAPAGKLPIFELKKAPIPEEKPSVKPPIGIMPEWLWKEKRLQDLQAAIKRYLLESQEPIPLNWIAEEYSLREWIENRNEEKRTQGGKD